MANVTARNVDDRDYAIIGKIAKENGRSISEELRNLIADYARRQRAEKLLAEMREISANSKPLPNGMTMQDLLREERDSW
jgi:UDP:flavonoid glycosyltransferase YjiC (YdhE family)